MDTATVKRLVREQADVVIKSNIVSRGQKKTKRVTVLDAVHENNIWKFTVEDGYGRVKDISESDILEYS